MATAEEAFRRWHASLEDPGVQVDLLRVEDGACVLAFSRTDGTRWAIVNLAPVDENSFFADGLEDPGEEVEEWLTGVNTSFAEKTHLKLDQALQLLIASVPKSVRCTAGDAEMADEDYEDDDLTMLAEVEVAENRSSHRVGFAEDQRWESLASSSASQGSRQASQVLMREMRALTSLQGAGTSKALEVEMIDDSLYHWSVKMYADGFPDDCALKSELRRFAAQHPAHTAAVLMDVSFPDSYPMSPPFIRVVRPRFKMHTGHVTIGGSVCMQLLTPSGWLPSVSLENVFVSIRSEMIEGGGQIDFAASHNDYSVAEAKEAFNRVAARYGWLAR